MEKILKRAKEIESHDHIVSHYCKLYAVEEILAGKLHLEDDKMASLAGQLLDDIEKEKQDIPENGKVYMEAFVMGIYEEALTEIAEARATRKTALSLLAASDFFTVLKLWEIDESSRIKMAKVYASRILKALKEGRDPNEGVRAQSQETRAQETASSYAADEIAAINEMDDLAAAQAAVAHVAAVSNNGPSEADMLAALGLDSVPADDAEADCEIDREADDIVAQTREEIAKDEEPAFTLPSAPQFVPTHEGETVDSDFKDDDLTLPSAPAFVDDAPSAPTFVDEAPSAPKFIDKAPPIKEDPLSIQQMMDLSEVITKAQKNAKFAISALNYEDIDTAVTQLTLALELLKNVQNTQF